MRILILGATGMLGYQICKTCIDRNITVRAVVRNKNLLMDHIGQEHSDKIDVISDIKDWDNIASVIIAFKPDYVINCIGVIKQSYLANDHYESIALNSFLPHQLAKLGNETGFRLIHISTDCVFKGEKGMYTESDSSDAFDLYGKTKFLGEVIEGCGITLRTSIIGHEQTESKHGLLDWFLSQSGSVKGFTKAIFSGVTTLELTRVILDVIIAQNVTSGLYQIASQPISKYDLLQMIADVYHKEIVIHPSEDLVVDRSLDGTKFYQLTSYKAPSWLTMLNEIYTDYLKNKDNGNS